MASAIEGMDTIPRESAELLKDLFEDYRRGRGDERIGTDENPVGRTGLDRTAVGVESKAVYRMLLGEAGNG